MYTHLSRNVIPKSLLVVFLAIGISFFSLVTHSTKASASTTYEYTENQCPGNIYSQGLGLMCMPHYLNASGAYWTAASFYQNPTVWNYYGGDYVGGYYHVNSTWIKGSGGQIWIYSGQTNAYFMTDVIAGTPIQVSSWYGPETFTLYY